MLSDSDPFPPDREGREAAVRRLEDEVAALVAGRLKSIVLSAYDRFLATLTAAGDVSALDSIPEEWRLFVLGQLGDNIGDIYLRGAVTAWARAVAAGVAFPPAFPELWAAAMNDMAITYQLAAENRLVNVGDALWSDIKAETVASISNNRTTEELKERIEDLSNFSEFRADTIARTETHRATTLGDRSGAVSLGRYGPTEHVWVTAGDSRVRPAHAKAHDQTRGFREPFLVGGERLLHPGEGSPENSIQCRCWEEMLYPGDERPDGSKVPA